MPRPALHRTEAVLDAARDLIIDGGPRKVGIRDIATRSGAPSGSLYHRFQSRDNLVAVAWLRAVRRFQEGFLAALAGADPYEAVGRAVAWDVDYALSEPADTRLLLCFSRADLLDAQPHPAVAEELSAANLALERALRQLGRRLFGSASAGHTERVSYAVVDLPYAVLRRHLLAGTLSRSIATSLRRAALAIVAERREPAG